MFSIITKFLVAREPQSSVTVRITPDHLGNLLAKCTDDAFEIAIEAFTSQNSAYNIPTSTKAIHLAKAAQIIIDENNRRLGVKSALSNAIAKLSIPKEIKTNEND